MHKIYVTHSRDFNYKQELYAPLRSSNLNTKYEIKLPHETDEFFNSKEIIKNSHFIIAEVSFPSTGQGIELGWASNSNVPIICLHKKGTKPSSSLQAVTDIIISYSDPEDMIKKVADFLEK